MIRIVHTGDLHLARGESDYGLAVLEEITAVCRRSAAAYLLVCGDLFDSFPDALVLAGEVRRLLEPLAGTCEPLFLPGNHEALRREQQSLTDLDLGPLKLLDRFAILRRRGVEFLCLPAAQGPGAGPLPPRRGFPAKREPWRVALAHGTVAGLGFPEGLSPEGEVDSLALDPRLFSRAAADYAALGHLHAHCAGQAGTVPVVYPGAPRVWRRGETGPKGVVLLELPEEPAENGGPVWRFEVLNSSGRFREVPVSVDFEGEAENLDPIAAQWGPADWVVLSLSGVVEQEALLRELQRRMVRIYGSRVRRLDIDSQGVKALPGIASHPLARRFLEAWQEQCPPAGQEYQQRVWRRARELGLAALAELLDSRP